MTARNETHIRIKSVLGNRSLTAIEVANEAGIPKMAAQAALRGMLRRREVRAARNGSKEINKVARYRNSEAA